ncbi:MAG: DUF362 domain-containing protein [Planctomycetes bacterium]|nr:DUF362 domain-containing protein [Planctomycetota bacterium]
MERAQVALAPLGREDESEKGLEAAVRAATDLLGGWDRFVRPGRRVLLKPNQTLWMPEKTGCTTSPRLVRVLVRMAFEAGAKEVWIAESSGHAQQSRAVMKNTGLAAGVKDTRARMIYLDEIAHGVYDFGPDAGDLRYMPVPEIMERADVIINVPKAKTHIVDPISCACKNWVGVMPQSFRLFLQRQGGPYYVGNAWLLRKFGPSLTIVDGGWAGEGQGPGGNEAFWWGWIVASADPVAADVTVARLFDLDASKVRMATEAARIGVGVDDPGRIDLLGAAFQDARRPVKAADPRVDIFPCNVIVGRRGATLEGTLGHWKTIADTWNGMGLWKLFTLRGRPTFLFGDGEDPDFEKHLKEGPYVVLDDAAQDRYKEHPDVTFVPGSPVPQSYMQHEMIEGMGFGAIYEPGLAVQKMISRFKGRRQAKG